METLKLSTMTYALDNGLARVVLNKPDTGNAIDGEFCADMNRLSIELSSNPAVRAVLLTANGRFFSVGGDIRTFTKDRAALPGMVKKWTADLHMGITRLQRMNAPVVTAVQGDVAGGSVSLVAFSDVVYAAEGVKLNAAFSMIGYCADSGSTISLSNRMGLSRAKRFLLLSETLTATEALEAGLVDFVTSPEALAETAEKTALKLARGATQAYGAIKRTIMSARIQGFEAQLEDEAQNLSILAAGEDAWEGLTAFAERRKPEFKGR